MSVDNSIVCLACNSQATIVEVKRYNGLRGVCLNCGGNWPES
ncbi:MAG: hypothetical protein OEL56_00575 [Nitrosopumilus sp.]|nr:hypothetical protein [Nitrosopumilus sp.]MDH3515395.1 hypothetical protein [Nitrosopumilus sp.]MDH3564304.1 hypothetical protein [Nitrosopumilus sp.]MDH5417187.1 hypothetical protein [Nitrosopumilus sp.]MDH5555026.1 hypothetical protein [Nitrosopumilus sp.]